MHARLQRWPRRGAARRPLGWDGMRLHNASHRVAAGRGRAPEWTSISRGRLARRTRTHRPPRLSRLAPPAELDPARRPVYTRPIAPQPRINTAPAHTHPIDNRYRARVYKPPPELTPSRASSPHPTSHPHEPRARARLHGREAPRRAGGQGAQLGLAGRGGAGLHGGEAPRRRGHRTWGQGGGGERGGGLLGLAYRRRKGRYGERGGERGGGGRARGGRHGGRCKRGHGGRDGLVGDRRGGEADLAQSRRGYDDGRRRGRCRRRRLRRQRKRAQRHLVLLLLVVRSVLLDLHLHIVNQHIALPRLPPLLRALFGLELRGGSWSAGIAVRSSMSCRSRA
ncbi:hypothetical protein FB451DRAFT_105054 [Mycena latifolia]|nr:hypothetical protein FB451DRAFT_105054 [Mycena latifolia]